jgi:alpha-glucosidase
VVIGFLRGIKEGPDPANMIHDMNQQGFKIVAILDPGVKIDKNYFLYNEGLKKNLFLKTRIIRLQPTG